MLLDLARTELNTVQTQWQRLDSAISGKQRAVRPLDTAAAVARSRLGDKVIDDDFFERDREVIHLTAPWLPDDVHRMREELFAAALAVKRRSSTRRPIVCDTISGF